ncbi:MAG: hypothetical protein NBV68_01660 [Erythrobacter sp.]|uniref:hypothetical protein n=1 Tax=Erythrobacter sp. TaxID=1042 RepID=UPI0025E82572|nr:hypothetical protein [Erythrobacter sp.]MCL9998064.1 hypothetical protein [Erythrobacter sp.]
MKAMFWVMGGWVLLTLARLIEAIGDRGATSSERLPIYFLGIGVLLGAAFCFIKAGRVVWDTFTGRNRGGGSGGNGPEGGARPARRLTDALPADGSDSFDADAAFARYMERRGDSGPQAPRASDQSVPPPQPRGFGRKGA